MKTFLIILGILIIGGGVYGYLIYAKNAPLQPVTCTMEAMICPDGSAVGRTGPNCEFAACPTPQGRSAEINSFTTCKVAGYPIMESYPERCRTPEGLTFVNYEACIQVIAEARNPQTGETRTFPTPCDVPEGWEKI